MVMTTVEIPESLLNETHSFVSSGMFSSDRDVVVAALSEFIRHHHPELAEQFAREDIEWAKGLRRHGDESGR